METYFLKEKDLTRFYDRISEAFELYVPIKAGSKIKGECDYLLRRFSDTKSQEVVFNEYRACEPIRAFFTYAKEEICGYFAGEAGNAAKDRPVAICGAKNCDLFSLKIQDFVFLGGDDQDPFYKSRRELALIISSDCPNFKEACFCRAFDINPYVNEGFDFNLSKIDEGYLVDVDSDKANKIREKLRETLSAATSGQLTQRAAKRESVIEDMEARLKKHQIPKKETLQEIVLAGHDSRIWQEQMLTCVECGGCVFMCDTCHCFLLADEPSGENAKRMRIWDGCLYKNFTRVAGGANPLRMRYMRLRNRYLKKFDFFISNMGIQACCGCGRCIDVCPGKIDIRYILRKLYEEKYLPAR